MNETNKRTQEQIIEDNIRRYQRLNRDASVTYNNFVTSLSGETKLVCNSLLLLFFVVSGIAILFLVLNAYTPLEAGIISVVAALSAIIGLIIWKSMLRKKVQIINSSYEKQLKKNYELLLEKTKEIE